MSKFTVRKESNTLFSKFNLGNKLFNKLPNKNLTINNHLKASNVLQKYG